MRYLRFLTIAMFLSLVSLQAFARSGQEVTKEKKISAQFNVQPGDNLDISNAFGSVHINTWDKKEVSVQIIITGKARTEDKAQAMVDKVSIKTVGTDSHHIFYKTEIAPTTGWGGNWEVNIDYVVNMPKTMVLDLVNRYGNVYTDDYEGKMTVTLAYGSLSMKKITGDGKNIKVSYGSGKIDMLESGQMDIAYSNLSIANSHAIFIKNRFGKLRIDAVKDLKIDQRYGDLYLGNVGSISGTVEYAGVNVEQLHKKAALSLRYCKRTDFKSVAATVENITIDGRYGSLWFKFEEGVDMSLAVNVEFGDVTSKSHVRTMDELKTLKHYTGKVGNGKGSMLIDLKYGGLTIQ